MERRGTHVNPRAAHANPANPTQAPKRAVASSLPLRLGVTGDPGITYNSTVTYARLQEVQPDAVLLVGCGAPRARGAATCSAPPTPLHTCTRAWAAAQPRPAAGCADSRCRPAPAPARRRSDFCYADMTQTDGQSVDDGSELPVSTCARGRAQGYAARR